VTDFLLPIAYANYMKAKIHLATIASSLFILHSASGFEGRIQATLTRGGQPAALLYTAGTNCLRVENTATNWPNPVDLLDRHSNVLTLLFPNNRSFVHLPPAADAINPPAPGALPMPMPPGGLPPGIGPQAATPPPGAPAMPQMLQMPAAGGMPVMPMMPMPMEKLELKATGETTNLLGYACARYEIKQRGETMEVWATDQLFPYQPYVQNQPHRFGPQMIEEQWGKLAQAQKLFPLLAKLKFDNGPEHFRFEVKAVTPLKPTDEDQKLFRPPDGYIEIEPLPF
jgi:hypothetical protein